jgi:hypothetical protein
MAKHGLAVRDFTGPFRAEIAASILAHGDLGFEPTVGSMRFTTEQLGADGSIADGCNLEQILWSTSHERLAAHYGGLLAEAVARRRRARELLAEVELLLRGKTHAVSAGPHGPQRTIPVETAKPKRVIPTTSLVRREVPVAG